MKAITDVCARLGMGFLNLIYPLACLICKTPLDPFGEECLCDNCKKRIEFNKPPFCAKCGKSLEASRPMTKHCRECASINYCFARNWAASGYSGVLKECIHSLKFKGRFKLLPFLNEFLFEFAMRYMDVGIYDVIMPVPLHKTKMRERSFNQAELLAKTFSRKTGRPVCLNNLVKTRHTRPQTDLSRRKRLMSVRGAFKIRDASGIKEKNVLLIDDVFTTGSTMNECAKILLENGARGVECLVLARG